jgi:hypothetical protein
VAVRNNGRKKKRAERYACGVDVPFRNLLLGHSRKAGSREEFRPEKPLSTVYCLRSPSGCRALPGSCWANTPPSPPAFVLRPPAEARFQARWLRSSSMPR